MTTHTTHTPAATNGQTQSLRAPVVLTPRGRRRPGLIVAGIALAMSDGTVIRRNRVYENYGEGIGVLSSTGVEVSSNTVYDNFSVNVYLDNAPRTLVQSNLIGATGNSGYFRNGRAPDGVLIANERTQVTLHSRDIRVMNNTMIGVREPYYGTYGLNSGLHNSVLSPNRIEPGRWLASSDMMTGS